MGAAIDNARDNAIDDAIDDATDEATGRATGEAMGKATDTVMAHDPYATDTTSYTDFGFTRIATHEKTARVHALFEKVATRYDMMNDIMSFGVHRLWKQYFVDRLAVRADETILDLAGGTGDIAGKIAARGARPVLCDLSEGMILAGKDRDLDRGRTAPIFRVCADAMRLPFADKSFDAVTMVFGLRNVTDIDATLHEIMRVLRYGGRFFCLEFSQPVLPPLQSLYDAYSFRVLPAMGQLFAHDRQSYQYLAESIRCFPDQAALEQRFCAAGFGHTRFENLSAGICALHTGWRL